MDEINIQVIDTEVIDIQVETPGVSKFIELEDVPQAYNDGKYVKSTVNGLVFDVPQGGGNMLKSVYDTNNDGVVDKAESVDGGTF